MDEYLQELIPKKGWICPGCGKKHKAPHYAYPGQVDETKKASEIGRVKFNRRTKGDRLDTNQRINHDYTGEADDFDEDGYPKPLFCPHCGWEDNWTILVRKGKTVGLIEQFKQVMNGNMSTIDAEDAIQQFMGFLKGKGVVKG